MALTRHFLKALELNEEQINSIVEAHTETISGVKDELKAEMEDLKSKYEKEHSDFENYKSEVSAKETKAAKEKAVKAYFESKGITGKSLAIAMRCCKSELDGIELDGEKIKDKTALDELVKGDFSGLVATTKIKGVDTANPPANTGGRMTKDQIFAIKDDTARQTAIAENHDLFGF